MENVNNALLEIPELSHLLEVSSANHSRLCPRQVLGVRMGLAGMQSLGLELSQGSGKLLVIIETDGCFADGIIASTGAQIGHRSLRIEDYGKVAATFVNTETSTAVRIHPKIRVREYARDFAPEERRRYYAMLEGYQVMPEEDLLEIQSVHLTKTLAEIISRPGIRCECQQCGEEVINEREVIHAGKTLCLSCAGPAYFDFI